MENVSVVICYRSLERTITVLLPSLHDAIAFHALGATACNVLRWISLERVDTLLLLLCSRPLVCSIVAMLDMWPPNASDASQACHPEVPGDACVGEWRRVQEGRRLALVPRFWTSLRTSLAAPAIPRHPDRTQFKTSIKPPSFQLRLITLRSSSSSPVLERRHIARGGEGYAAAIRYCWRFKYQQHTR